MTHTPGEARELRMKGQLSAVQNVLLGPDERPILAGPPMAMEVHQSAQHQCPPLPAVHVHM